MQTVKSESQNSKWQRLARWQEGCKVSFFDQPGTLHEINGYRVKAIRCQYGYVLYLIDAAGGQGSLLPTGEAQSLKDCLAKAVQLLANR